MERFNAPAPVLNLFALSARTVAFSSRSSTLLEEGGGWVGVLSMRRREEEGVEAYCTVPHSIPRIGTHRSVLRKASSMFFCITPVTESTLDCKKVEERVGS
jgi:hypothetical protein